MPHSSWRQDSPGRMVLKEYKGVQTLVLPLICCGISVGCSPPLDLLCASVIWVGLGEDY
jgi:hypothetical protein